MNYAEKRYAEVVEEFEKYFSEEPPRTQSEMRKSAVIRLSDFFYALKNKRYAVVIYNCYNHDRLWIYCANNHFGFDRCELNGASRVYLIKTLEKVLGVPYWYKGYNKF